MAAPSPMVRPAATSALISGFNDGIYIQATLGTATNFGTVVAGANAIGSSSGAGGIVRNGTPGTTGAVITSGYIGSTSRTCRHGRQFRHDCRNRVQRRRSPGRRRHGQRRGSGSTAALVSGNSGVRGLQRRRVADADQLRTITVTAPADQRQADHGRPTPNSISNFGTIVANLATGIDLQKGGLVTKRLNRL